MFASLSCSYNSISNELTVTNPTTTNYPGGTQMKFTVDNIRNPYSALPRTGFTLTTYDSGGYKIDYTTDFVFTVNTLSSL